MKKRLISMILVFSVVVVSPITANAAETATPSKMSVAKELNLNASEIENVEYVKCSVSNTDEVVKLSYDGKELPKKDVDSQYELRKVELKNSNRSLYILSASSDLKRSTGSKDISGIKMHGTIAWYDNPGSDNELYYVSGSRSGTYKGGSYVYGKSSGYDSKFNYAWDSASFTDYRHMGMHGFCFVLTLSMRDKNNNVVRMSVTTSIFD